MTLTWVPFRHWAAAFFFLLEDVARAVVVATPRLLEPPELEGNVVVMIGAASGAGGPVAGASSILALMTEGEDSSVSLSAGGSLISECTASSCSGCIAGGTPVVGVR